MKTDQRSMTYENEVNVIYETCRHVHHTPNTGAI